MSSHTAEGSSIVIGFLMVNLLYASSQPVTTINNGFGSEGRIYHAMAKGFPRVMPPRGTAPDVYRPGMPFLAAAVAKTLDWVISAGFDRLNIFFNAWSVAGLTLLLRRHVASPPARLIVIAAFMIEPHSPVRYAYYAAIDVTPATMALLVAGLCSIEWCQDHPRLFRAAVVAVWLGIGVLVHEMLLLPAVCVFACDPPEEAERDWRWLPLAVATATFLLVRSWTVETPSGFSGYDEIIRGLREKSLLQYGLAWLLVFGPLLAVPVFFWRASARFLIERPVFLVYLSVTALLAWSVGGDSERLLVLASPVVYVLIAHSIMCARLEPMPAAMVGLLLAQALSSRIFTAVGGPIEPPVAIGEVWERLGSASVKSALSYDNMWSRTCAPAMTRMYLLWYGVVCGGVLGFLWSRNSGTDRTPAGTQR